MASGTSMAVPAAGAPAPQTATPLGPALTVTERDRRWAAVRGVMRRLDVNALIVGSFRGRERHEAYLIDDEVDGCVVFPVEGDPTVLTWSATFISRTQYSIGRGMSAWATDIRIGRHSDDLIAVLRERDLSGGRVGVVGLSATSPGELEGVVPYSFWSNVIQNLPAVTFIDATQPYADLTLVRSGEELQLLRHAAVVSERAVAVMIETVRPGVTEAEVYAAIASEVYRNGCYLKYPYLSLHSGSDNLGWGPPRWTLRAEPPRRLARGDLVQAEIHTCYGGMEGQVQASVALDPVADDVRRCEAAVYASYEAALEVVRPGIRFSDVVTAMERPLREAGCWAKTPLVHTLTFGATGFSAANRDQLAGTAHEAVDRAAPASRRLDLELVPGMPLELEPNACIGDCRVNVGGVAVVTESGCEPLNDLSSRVHHIA